VAEGRLRVAMTAPAFGIISTGALIWEEVFVNDLFRLERNPDASGLLCPTENASEGPCAPVELE
jgi:hypothetical protein